MVERQGELEIPRTPRRRRRGPGPAQVWAQRVVALALLGGAAFAAWYLVHRATEGTEASKPVTTTVAPAVAPPPKPLRIVFPEGFTRAEMAARITAVDAIAKRKRHVTPRLKRAAYLGATKSWRTQKWFEPKPVRRPLEGFLFPATYDFTKRTTSAQLVQQQLKTFRQRWSTVDLSYARSKNLTPYDVLIIASMIEKEAAVPVDRPKIAAVIYNRLHDGMKLDIDATIRYALNIPGTESLRESQLETQTPYNTRLNAGLPPTPIANPGLASIRAAAHPAKVDYLYFVANPKTHRHFFTASFDEFNRYKAAHGYGPH
jgi:uncharacterized YceG family protein